MRPWNPEDIGPADALLIMENRELLQRLNTMAAQTEHVFDLLKGAQRALVAAELALKRWRNS